MSDQFKDLDLWKTNPLKKRMDNAMETDDLQLALKEIEEVLKDLPTKGFEYAHAKVHKGVILCKMGKRAEAIKMWEEALADPDGQVDVDGRYNLNPGIL